MSHKPQFKIAEWLYHDLISLSFAFNRTPGKVSLRSDAISHIQASPLGSDLYFVTALARCKQLAGRLKSLRVTFGVVSKV